MKIKFHLLPILALGITSLCSIQAQTGVANSQPVASPTVAPTEDQGYILTNGQAYLVRGNTAYPLTGDITQRISPAAASTLREGYMLTASGQLVVMPQGLNYSPLPAPTTSVEAERTTAARPVTGANSSGLAPANTNNVNAGNGTAPVNRNATSNTGIPIQNAPVYNGAIPPGANRSGMPQGQGGAGTGTGTATGTQQNGTQPQITNGVQQNGTQPQVTDRVQPNGTTSTGATNAGPRLPNNTNSGAAGTTNSNASGAGTGTSR